jgi:hypothetical protein
MVRPFSMVLCLGVIVTTMLTGLLMSLFWLMSVPLTSQHTVGYSVGWSDAALALSAALTVILAVSFLLRWREKAASTFLSNGRRTSFLFVYATLLALFGAVWIDFYILHPKETAANGPSRLIELGILFLIGPLSIIFSRDMKARRSK